MGDEIQIYTSYIIFILPGTLALEVPDQKTTHGAENWKKLEYDVLADMFRDPKVSDH